MTPQALPLGSRPSQQAPGLGQGRTKNQDVFGRWRNEAAAEGPAEGDRRPFSSSRVGMCV